MEKTNINKINWFPGHMKKATDEIIRELNKVDLIIEVLDARAIDVTSNDELIDIAKNKLILRIALKQDLCDLREEEINGVLIGSTKDKKFRKRILNEMVKVFQPKIDKLKSKGLISYQFLVMVIGIPNVGKSSLINFLSEKSSLKTENRAGVTKSQSTRKINDNFYLVDTPGVLFKKIENIEDGYKLSIINCISKRVLPLHDIIQFTFNYFRNNYLKQMQSYFEFNIPDDYLEFLDLVCKRYGLLLKNNENDYTRAYDLLFNLFSNANITRFHFN